MTLHCSPTAGVDRATRGHDFSKLSQARRRPQLRCPRAPGPAGFCGERLADWTVVDRLAMAACGADQGHDFRVTGDVALVTSTKRSGLTLYLCFGSSGPNLASSDAKANAAGASPPSMPGGGAIESWHSEAIRCSLWPASYAHAVSPGSTGISSPQRVSGAC